MKISFRFFAPLFLVLSLTLASCDSSNDANDSENNSLYVKFTNSPTSEYTITDIYHMDMGKSGESKPTPSGVWSENIMKTNQTLAPGETTFFTLNIPNSHYSQCRFGVLNDDSVRIMLHEQSGFGEGIQAPITHWGSDERTVSVTIKKSGDLIVVIGWSDWAGID